MRVTNARLIVASLTFFLGVLLVYFANGMVTPIFVAQPEYRCKY
jgi:hypothetical protein